MANNPSKVVVAYDKHECNVTICAKFVGKKSATETRIRVARVRAEYPNQLDYSGSCIIPGHSKLMKAVKHIICDLKLNDNLFEH